MEISPPILVKNILWLPHINLNEVISKNLILNIIIVIFNTSSGAKKVMPSLHYFVLLFFYVCMCLEGKDHAYISCMGPMPSFVYSYPPVNVDQRILDL